MTKNPVPVLVFLFAAALIAAGCEDLCDLCTTSDTCPTLNWGYPVHLRAGNSNCPLKWQDGAALLGVTLSVYEKNNELDLTLSQGALTARGMGVLCKTGDTVAPMKYNFGSFKIVSGDNASASLSFSGHFTVTQTEETGVCGNVSVSGEFNEYRCTNPATFYTDLTFCE